MSFTPRNHARGELARARRIAARRSRRRPRAQASAIAPASIGCWSNPGRGSPGAQPPAGAKLKWPSRSSTPTSQSRSATPSSTAPGGRMRRRRRSAPRRAVRCRRQGAARATARPDPASSRRAGGRTCEERARSRFPGRARDLGRAEHRPGVRARRGRVERAAPRLEAAERPTCELGCPRRRRRRRARRARGPASRPSPTSSVHTPSGPAERRLRKRPSGSCACSRKRR